jgi:hypothetical protein
MLVNRFRLKEEGLKLEKGAGSSNRKKRRRLPRRRLCMGSFLLLASALIGAEGADVPGFTRERLLALARWMEAVKVRYIP